MRNNESHCNSLILLYIEVPCTQSLTLLDDPCEYDDSQDYIKSKDPDDKFISHHLVWPIIQ